QLVVVGAEALRDEAREWELVELALEADRERLDGARRRLGHRGYDRRGVDAAGQERAERDVRDHAAADRRAQLVPDLLERLLLRGEVALRRVVELPVALAAGAALVEHEDVPGAQLAD